MILKCRCFFYTEETGRWVLGELKRQYPDVRFEDWRWKHYHTHVEFELEMRGDVSGKVIDSVKNRVESCHGKFLDF